MPGVPAVPAPGLIDGVRRVLGTGGALASVLDGFEPRASQQQMAEAVARVVTDGGVLLAEAGTGTGKTLAYLVPAILSGRKVLVSTGTRNLQEQLIDKDVPLLQRALGPFRATCMKGRGNYLCLHRFEQALHDDRARDDETRVAMTLIEHWAPRTATGDRAELADLPEDLPFWHGIAATTENCLGSECPRYTDCFVTRMRQEAAEADVVIVNHHLLCADAAVRRHSFGEVIPECQVGIVDEAHQLEDVATQYFGVSVSNYRVEQLFTDAAAIRTTPLFVPRHEAEAVARAIEALATTSRAFFLDLQTRRARRTAIGRARRGALRRTPARDRRDAGRRRRRERPAPDRRADVRSRRRWRSSRTRPRTCARSPSVPARSATTCASCSGHARRSTSTFSRFAGATSRFARRRSTSRTSSATC